MGKSIYYFVFMMFLVIFGIASYAIYKNEFMRTVVEKNDLHVHKITIANSISSFSKRAEGHLFLYLMLGNSIDREKFYQRSTSLKIEVQRLKALLSVEQNGIDYQMSNNVEKFVLTGNHLLTIFDDTQSNTGVFPFKKHVDKITQFHDLSSDLRKSGVDFVEKSAKILKREQAKLIYGIKTENFLIATCLGISILLLIIVIRRAHNIFQASGKLHQFSYTDGLTDIANRRFFDEQFLKEWNRACRTNNYISIMMIDIDYFKQYNDSYGHSEGDFCLIAIAKALKNCLKRPSDFVARYGGEEFVIILPETNNAVMIAEQCKKAVENLHILHCRSEISNVVTITIGFGTIKPIEGSSAQGMLKRIDLALYRGKEEGRNRIQTI